jgi:3alpha(or 20beta)-hydroxysteroid dehydrogenase
LKVGPLVEIPPADYLELVRVNQLGVLLGMPAAVPLLRQAGGGSILNVASVDGMKGMAGAGAYGSTKWAVRGITKAAAVELGRDRIRVNTINPGGCETPMSAPDNLEGMDIKARDFVLGTWALGRMSQPEELGGLDVLVANAAVLQVGPLLATSPEDYLELVRVNQLGVLLGMQAVAPLLRAAGGGSIVNVASVDATRGMAGAGAYGSTKRAVRGLTKTAALELGRDGIRVNAILPGGVATPMTSPDALAGMGDVATQARDRVVASWALGRMSEPDELGGLATFLASDESAYCTGADFTIDGGQTAGTLLLQR